jgi:hypothetical protein
MVGDRLPVSGDQPAVDSGQPTADSAQPAASNQPHTANHETVAAHQPCEIRITIQRTADAERDKRLLSWVVDVLRARPGRDRFCIVLRKNGAAVQLDFPNDTTGVTAALEQQLVRRLGMGSVEIREITES